MPLTKEKFERYAELKKQIKEAEAEIEELLPDIESEMNEIGPDAKVNLHNIGSFSFMKKKKWTYSEKVGELDVALKTTKKAEEADGTATYEENLIVIFKEAKV